jgi:protein-tyrosine phosphatase
LETRHERHIEIAGDYNVRELGGYRTTKGATTRWRRFLRADLLGDISPESVAALTEYRIKTAIDLRAVNLDRVFQPQPAGRRRAPQCSA